jgi:hypothetical protein
MSLVLILRVRCLFVLFDLVVFRFFVAFFDGGGLMASRTLDDCVPVRLA